MARLDKQVQGAAPGAKGVRSNGKNVLLFHDGAQQVTLEGILEVAYQHDRAALLEQVQSGVDGRRVTACFKDDVKLVVRKLVKKPLGWVTLGRPYRMTDAKLFDCLEDGWGPAQPANSTLAPAMSACCTIETPMAPTPQTPMR